MDLDKYKDQDILLVTPNSSKLSLLRKYDQKLLNIKYMTLEEYKSHYFFSYDDKTISYLMTKYNYHLDVSKILIKQLYVIDLEKDYKNEKLKELKKIKQELIDNQLLYFDYMFQDYLKNKKVIVYKYDTLDKYEKEMFLNATIINEEENILKKKVIKCDTLENEVLYVITEIIKLIRSGISLNHIYLSNIDNEYLYTVKSLFNYFHIPINIDIKESIYGTKIVKDYLKTKKIPSFQNRVTTKLIDVINSLVMIEDDPNYEIFLIDKLKHTYLKPIKYKEAVNIIDYKTSILEEDDYLFLLGFNQDIIPKTYKDLDYINDSIKDEVSLYKTIDKNIQEKSSTISILSNIKNLYLSYKEKSNFNNYLKSSIISDLDLEEEEYNSNQIYDSNIYNKLLLGQYLDNYYKYGEINKNLSSLIGHYQIPYNTYNNNFTGIDNSLFLEYINNHLKVSYTSINSYNNCAFKYYINYILRVNPFEDTFSIFIGNLFHHVFSKMYDDNFNFEQEWDTYLEKRELSLQELFFIKDLKIRLLEDIDMIKKQELFSTYSNTLCEEEINIPINKKIDVVFTGKIDKIKYKRNINDTYFSLIDYKTGNINTSINNMKYGLDMQLPIYLYLLSNSNLFENPIFTGIYFQRVLYPSFKWELGKNLEEIKENNLKLQGYSTDNQERLYQFDKTYENSEIIKGIKINRDSSFSKTSKILSDDEVYNVLKYTKEKVEETVDKILDGNFSINPKIIDKKSSCEHCSFKDICYVNPSNYNYLEKVENLDFLGGE